MAIGANSYGSVAEVEALVPRYATNSGAFSASTRPTTTQVEKFIDRVSGIVNALLAEQGFDIPVDDTDPKLVLDDFVINQVVQLCHAVNSAGPYAPGSQELRNPRQTPFQVMMKEAESFIDNHADGLEQLGATRTRTLTDGLSCRLTDDSGDDLEPPFQWKQFGNEVIDWDTG
jgi:hypothetical protein